MRLSEFLLFVSPLSWWLENREIESEYVFVCLDRNAFTTEHYGKTFAYRLQFMRRLCDKAGVKRFGFHAIRHLTASQLFKKGYSVGIIQAILRHKSPSTTERYLKTLGLENVREALENLTGKEVGRRLNLRLIHLEKNDGSNDCLKKSRHSIAAWGKEKGNQI